MLEKNRKKKRHECDRSERGALLFKPIFDCDCQTGEKDEQQHKIKSNKNKKRGKGGRARNPGGRLEEVERTRNRSKKEVKQVNDMKDDGPTNLLVRVVLFYTLQPSPFLNIRFWRF